MELKSVDVCPKMKESTQFSYTLDVQVIDFSIHAEYICR